MPNIKPVSDLRNYNAVLNDIPKVNPYSSPKTAEVVM